MKENRIYYLYKRYLTNTLTVTEQKELQNILADPVHEEFFKSMLDNTWDSLSESELTDISKTKAAYIYQSIVSQRKKRVLKKINWPPIAAAIVSLLLIGGLSFYFYFDKEEHLLVSLHSENLADITPGKGQPQLILADGTKIALKADKDGVIAKPKRLTYNDGSPLFTNRSLGHNSPSYSINTIVTPIGGQYKVIMPDGTKVWLNSASSLKFPDEFGDKREVSLEGEGYFEVKKDKKRPFIVKTAQQEITVLGTQFNISAYSDDHSFITTLLSGAVKVKKIAAKAANQFTGKEQLLSPGQQAITSTLHQNIYVETADTIEAKAWKEGLFIFNNQSIGDIMKELTRWYNIDVQYEGNVKDVHFIGNYSREKGLLNLLKNIELVGNVHFKVEQDTIKKERRILVMVE